jgi:PAS domain-containing protein
MDGPAFDHAAADSGRQMLALVEAEVGSLLELLPLPVLVTSDDGAVLRANPQAAALLGCPDGRLVGQHIDHLLQPGNFSVRMTTLCHQTDAMRLYVLADVTSPGWARD